MANLDHKKRTYIVGPTGSVITERLYIDVKQDLKKKKKVEENLK